ncbi:MAG: Glu/Leu/Phe/Val dehydrogenase [Lachnospiraceae bacterium]|nr:Glu/Leu/Phe/Val dehydrogenase [Candidatus Minthocola equi]
MSSSLEMIREFGHEEVAFFNNEKVGLKCIIAIHSTKLGPAVGGCRLNPYDTEEEALFDVLRLSRGMSYKNACAGLPLGGAKGIIIARPDQKTEALFEAYGECVNSLGGRYITAEDVRTNCENMEWVMRKTPYVTGRTNVSGSPSPFTAIGVYDGIRATAKFLFGSDDLSGLKIAVAGLGSVGMDLAERLAKAGAKLIVTTHTNRANIERAVKEFGAVEALEGEIYSTECDILAPCALGATLNYQTIPELKCKAVAGAANNQLLDDNCGEMLKKRGIAYAPDFIINAGGVINAGQEAFTTYNEENVLKQVHKIYDTVYTILDESKSTGIPEGIIATKMAEEIIANGGKK